jgi:small subunit ribosomal protein S17
MAEKSLTGTVVSDKMEKTVIVLVRTTKQHRLYRKILQRTKRYMAHDDRLESRPGDIVRIVETRPLSRNKRWRVAEIVKRGEVPEVEAREIDTQYLAIEREREAPPPPAAARETAEPEAAAPPAVAESETEEAPAAAEPATPEVAGAGASAEAEPDESAPAGESDEGSS